MTDREEAISEFINKLCTYSALSSRVGELGHEPSAEKDDLLGLLGNMDGELGDMFRDYVETAGQLYENYQDISKTYFNFIERVEETLGLTAEGQIDEEAIIGAVRKLKTTTETLAVKPWQGVRTYAPTVVDDPTFLVAMKQHEKGKWISKEDHLDAFDIFHEKAKSDLCAKEDEIAVLKQELTDLKEKYGHID